MQAVPSMPDTAFKLRARLEAAGWTVAFITENSISIAGAESPGVNNGVATRGDLFAKFAYIARCEDGDIADQMYNRPMASCLREGSAKCCVTVLDGVRARGELEKLGRGLSSFTQALRTVPARGWVIEHSREDTWDSPGYEIRAQQPGLRLELNVSYPATVKGPIITKLDRGQATWDLKSSGRISVSVRSQAEATSLLDRLTQRS